jgi:hypothetical protein
MSTWHQDQNPRPLWHVSKWTVVTEGYGRPVSVARWSTAEEAREDALRTCGYVLAPGPGGSTR